MIARNTTIEEMERALKEVNKKYEDNITWNRFEKQGKAIRFTLRCKDSKKAGHRRGFHRQRLVSACWHVHGHFFEELMKINENAVIFAGNRKIDKYGGNWQDWNIGSILNPVYYSQACDC